LDGELHHRLVDRDGIAIQTLRVIQVALPLPSLAVISWGFGKSSAGSKKGRPIRFHFASKLCASFGRFSRKVSWPAIPPIPRAGFRSGRTNGRIP
jgi:hypothetical protein